MDFKILGLLIGLVILVLILYFSGIEKVFQIILNANLFFITIAMLLLGISVYFKSLRWLYFLKSVKIYVPYSHAFYSFNSALFIGNLVPFKAFEILRGYFLKFKFKISFSKTIPLVLVERALDVFIYILFSIVTLQAMIELLPPNVALFAFITMFIFLFIAILVLLILNSKKIMLIFFKMTSKLPLLKNFDKKLRKMANSFLLGFNQLKKSKALFKIIFLTLLIWIIECLIFLFSAKAVGINLPLVLFTLPLLSILLGSLTFVPGGLGSIEAIFILFLSLLGISIPQATSAVLIYRALVHVGENLIGAIVLSNVYGIDMFKKAIKKLS
jgi:uncharacterized protein (TIRG00374 family)